jgi:hypothetical protein
LIFSEAWFIREMMEFSEFHKKVRKILDIDLPPAGHVINEGRLMAEDVKIGRTAFMDKMGLASEVEYKRACIRECFQRIKRNGVFSIQNAGWEVDPLSGIQGG